MPRAWARRALITLAILATAHGSLSARQAAPPLAVSEYIAALDQLIINIEALDAAQPQRATAVLAGLPRAWRVTAGDVTADISTDWVRRDLHAWQQQPTAAARTALIERLRFWRDEAASAAAPTRDAAAARVAMARVFEDPAFRSVHGPTWSDRLQQRLLRFLQRVLASAVGSSMLPAITTTFVYALIALGAIAIAIRLHRSLRRHAERDMTREMAVPIESKSWSRWLAEASDAAARGDWRQAVRFTYWAGIAHLESQGAWRPDRSRTPREYLRLVPASSPHAAPLGTMTRLLERVWYGTERADASRYDQALVHLKDLGCPSR
jgi:hypothetical protein